MTHIASFIYYPFGNSFYMVPDLYYQGLWVMFSLSLHLLQLDINIIYL